VARQRLANRFDLSLPENQRKLEAAGQLGELAGKTGITLIEMAIAFVLCHPAITSAIIGPRTMEHLESQLTAVGTVLSYDVLDQIDQIVPPGITLNPADNGWVSPALQASARRR
jgi:aryl-alcohol dehydrogenase-like predicted oxidoreductase